MIPLISSHPRREIYTVSSSVCKLTRYSPRLLFGSGLALISLAMAGFGYSVYPTATIVSAPIDIGDKLDEANLLVSDSPGSLAIQSSNLSSANNQSLPPIATEERDHSTLHLVDILVNLRYVAIPASALSRSSVEQRLREFTLAGLMLPLSPSWLAESSWSSAQRPKCSLNGCPQMIEEGLSSLKIEGKICS